MATSGIPSWLPGDESAFEGKIIGIIATWVLGGIFGLWSALLTMITELYGLLADLVWSLSDALATATSPGELLLEAMRGLVDSLAMALTGLGLAAPIGAVIAWLVVVGIVAILLNAATGLVATYVPFRALPVVGRWFS